MKKIILIAVLIPLIISGCSRFKKPEVGEAFHGPYQGKVTYILKFSQVRKELKDQKESRYCRIAIYEQSNVTYLKCSEGVLILSGITTSNDSLGFRISPQKFSEAKQVIPVQGKPLTLKSWPVKSDGLFTSRNNSLRYSISGVIPFTKDTMTVKIPFEAIYQLIKLDVDSLKKERLNRVRK